MGKHCGKNTNAEDFDHDRENSFARRIWQPDFFPGRTPAIGAMPVEATLAMMDIQLERVVVIKMAEDHQNAVIDLVNGDKVTEVIKLGSFELETLFGKASVGVEHIQSLRVALLGGRRAIGLWWRELDAVANPV